ncbi:Non-reducing end alpha-L-arabinofuranosidase BoGH43A [Colletotrichum spinosum]|uniref:Non-reducing end alpha-L-arabinofuranosidase BoGH43A n=1 Tax=Colletotrichum spinosum TaxID=1347390 RepID=A0A4R8PQA2_9PEZI|nr:Non-reducing end alpha-L-arabinofuranosidase BoGH43A [Colletotrichum spinosum]
MRFIGLVWLFIITLAARSQAQEANKTFHNPILPGWNSDPSCAFVKEWDNTFFCTTSSFLAFPGVPVYASKDLVNWKLASNALTKDDQLPELYRNSGQHEGIWASTIRYHEGTFYLITSYVSWYAGWGPKILLFTTKNPYDDASWTGPLHIENPANDIDPDLFWDSGKVYMSVAAGIYISEVDLTTGTATEPVRVWNGTGDRNPEGPHLFNKDGYYYLLIGEGGTETNHSVTIARGREVTGPFEGYEGNPILTAKNTDEYFQTVGHADFFQDAAGNWWGVALATRSGPAWEIYPMGRETVLFAVTWEEGQWPILDMVRGTMTGPLPKTNKDIPGNGHWIDEPDVVDFEPGSALPRHFFFWRPPKTSLFAISPAGHPNTFQISPSPVNLSATPDFNPEQDGLGFIARKQSATLFNYTVDVDFKPEVADEEAGITVFLTQVQHIDLGIVNLPACAGESLVPRFRFRVEASGKPNITVPEEIVIPVPKAWRSEKMRLFASAVSDSEYVFGASPASRPEEYLEIGSASALIVSGGSGPFTGTVIGSYATSNGGEGKTPAYFSRWRYTQLAQKIDDDTLIPATDSQLLNAIFVHGNDSEDAAVYCVRSSFSYQHIHHKPTSMANVDTSIGPHTTGAAAKLAAQHSEEHALKLYGGWFCPFVQRAWIVLCEKRIPHQYIEINPYKKDPEFLKLNPRGLVPTLAVPVDAKGDEQRPLYDSTVLCEYLDEAYAGNSHGPHLLPDKPYDRARCRLWIDHINSRIVPAFYKFIQHTPEKEYTIQQARDEFLGHIKTLAKELAPEGPWFLGQDLSLVDIVLAPWAMRLFLIDHYKPGGLGLPEEGAAGDDENVWRRWRQWYKAIEERRSVQDTLSDREAYIEVYQRYAEDKTNSEVGQATRSGKRMP